MKRFLATALAVLLSAVSALASGPTPVPASFFGITTNNPTTSGHYPACGTFGVFRDWDTHNSWVEINPSSGSFNFSGLNARLALAGGCGAQYIYTVGHTPTWASARKTEPCSGGIGHQVGSCAEPEDVGTTDQHLKDFITALVNDGLAQSKHIDYIEVWNEPNSANFFTGTPAQMVRMATDIRNTAKALDPGIQIIGPSPSGCTAGGCNSFPWLTSYYAAGGAAPQDIVGFHAYMHDNQPDPQVSLFNYISQIQGLQATNGISSKPIRFTEGSDGDGTADGFGGGVLTQDQRSAYLAIMYALMWSKSISGFDWYSYDSTSFGPLCNNAVGGCPLLPAGIARQRMYTWLVGSTSPVNPCAKGSDSTWACPLTLANGHPARLLWNTAATKSFALDPALGFTQFETLDNTTVSNISGGSVTVSSKPILVEGPLAPPPPPPITVAVSPTSNSVQVGTQTPVTALLTNDTTNAGAAWSVTCGSADCGGAGPSPSQSGVPINFTAPATVPTPPTVNVKATSVADTGASATSIMTITAAPPPPPPPPPQQGATVQGSATLGTGAANAISFTTNPQNFNISVGQSQNIIIGISNDVNNLGANVTITGPGCSGSTCGLVNLSFVRDGQTIIYTAPASVPSPSAVTITLTSIQNPQVFVNIQVTLTGNPPPIPSVPLPCHPNFQAAAATNVFVCAATTNSTVIIPVATSTSDVISSVQACSPSDVCTTLTPACPIAGPCIATTIPGGDVSFYHGFNLPLGLTRFKVNNSTPAGSVDPVIYNPANVGGFDKAVQSSPNNTPTTNPTGPVISTAIGNELVIAMLSSTGSVTGLASPFTFTATTFGNGDGYAIPATPTTLTPNWTTASGTWAAMAAAYSSGTSTGAISVSILPVAPTVVTTTTQSFTVIVTNDSANAGVTLGLACTGGCGSVPGTAASGVAFNYTAPGSVPGSTVTLTATSVTDPTKTATAVITVATTPVVSVTLVPVSANVLVGGNTQTFTATVANGTGNQVTLALTGACSPPNCGTLSTSTVTSGVPFTYTSPAALTSPPTITLTATSVDDGTKTDTSTILLTTPAVSGCATPTSCPAFSGAAGVAQGSGAEAIMMGRNGTGTPSVIEVTNLNDAGSGSLRACMEASGPRACIFRVTGIIHPVTTIRATSPYLYVAGQTSPGSGITLQGDLIGGSLIFFSTHDIVFRYITCRIGLGAGHSAGPGTGADCLEITSGTDMYNIVADHISMSWWDNKGWITYCNDVCTNGVHDSTLQWSLLEEPNVAHHVGPMTDAKQNNLLTTNQDFHHNLIQDNDHRLPLVNTRSGRWVNNIVSNYGCQAGYVGLWQGATIYDIIGNFYRNGNVSGNVCSVRPFGFNTTQSSDCNGPNCNMNGNPSTYLLNNLTPMNSSLTNVPNDSSQLGSTGHGTESSMDTNPIPGTWLRSTPLSSPPFPITVDNPNNLGSIVAPTVGNSQRLNCDGTLAGHRDVVDNRLINEFQTAAAGVEFTVVDANHTVPTPIAGTLCTETLHDGIPDQWKTAHGLSTVDATLWKTVNAANHYTYLENYLNVMAP